MRIWCSIRQVGHVASVSQRNGACAAVMLWCVSVSLSELARRRSNKQLHKNDKTPLNNNEKNVRRRPSRRCGSIVWCSERLEAVLLGSGNSKQSTWRLVPGSSVFEMSKKREICHGHSRAKTVANRVVVRSKMAAPTWPTPVRELLGASVAL